MLKINCVLFFLVFYNLGITPTSSVTLDEFLTLTQRENEALDKFKDRVLSRLPNDYMKRDIYLVRWLRDSHFDVKRAERRLMENLDWRKENNMDSILDEDWSVYAAEYKAYAEGCDREGKPISSVYFGDWDFRKEVIAGKTRRIMRYGDLLLEEAATVTKNMRNVTQAWLIVEMKNFNLIQHGCPNCLAVYINIIRNIQQHYPGYIHKLVFVNTPTYALSILDALKPFMNKEFRKTWSIYGANRKQWRKELFREIDRDQLSRNFGGSRAEGTDLDIIRRNKYVFKCPK